MLAQTGVAWDVRVRMADTDEAGNPGTSAPTVSTEVAHIVYTLDNTGQVYIFTDGVERGVVRPGDLSSWDSGYELTLGNDTTLDSPWAGTVHLAAIYCVALTTDEVDANFRSGF
jgi:hypothetical protein